MRSRVWFTALVAGVGLERLAELVVSNRNREHALAQGGSEVGAGHYPVMVALHTGLLAGALAEAWLAPRPFRRRGWVALGAVGGSQALRWWCIRTLGRQWNTRVLVIPGGGRIQHGPYRRLRHPNYLAVVVEGAALPLVHDARITAATFGLANAVLLRHRIRVEDAALAGLDHALG